MTSTRSAMDQALTGKLQLIEIPSQYLKSLYLAQVFELLLWHLLGYLISSVRVMVLKEGAGVIDYMPSLPDVDKVTLHEMYKRIQTFLRHSKYEKLIKCFRYSDSKKKQIHSQRIQAQEGTTTVSNKQ